MVRKNPSLLINYVKLFWSVLNIKFLIIPRLLSEISRLKSKVYVTESCFFQFASEEKPHPKRSS